MNRTLQGCVPFAALSLVGVLVWPFVAGPGVMKVVLGLWILGFGALGLAKFRMGLESRDRYDLRGLRKIHERVELSGAEVPDVALDADTAVCPRCGGAGPSQLPVCAQCGHVF